MALAGGRSDLHLLLGLDLEDLPIAVVAALLADAVGALGRATLRTGRARGWRQRIVGAAHARLRLRHLLLRANHDGSFSLASPSLCGGAFCDGGFGAGLSTRFLEELSETRERTVRLLRLARARLPTAHRAAHGAEAQTGLCAERLHWPGERQDLQNDRAEV